MCMKKDFEIIDMKKVCYSDWWMDQETREKEKNKVLPFEIEKASEKERWNRNGNRNLFF